MKYLAMFLSWAFGVLTVLFLMSMSMMLLGVESPDIPIVLENTDEYARIKWELVGCDFGQPIMLVVSYFLFAVTHSLHHRLRKKKCDTLNADAIEGPFVLYLRSFIADRITSRRISLFADIRSEEETLVDVLSEIAPVYAIGDPKDKKMPVGASRIYVDDGHWKTTVEKLSQKAVVVVLRLGETDSFWWEVEMAAQKVPLEKLLFVVPECKTFSNVATLYKVLLDNKIDIKSAGISIDRKSRGSISSFMFFGHDGTPVAKSVKIPRFTQIVVSYENILRNALAEFRAKYGLHARWGAAIRWVQLLQIVVVGSMFLTFVSLGVRDFTRLNCQMPYELLEKCVEYPEFTAKYSDKINGTNLTWAFVEAEKGSFWLPDSKYKFRFFTELKAQLAATSGECVQFFTEPRNSLLMIKKYVPECYDEYVGILAEAAILSIRLPGETDELIAAYQNKLNDLPQWMKEFLAHESELFERRANVDGHDNLGGVLRRFAKETARHADDHDFVDGLKVLRTITIKSPVMSN